MSEPRDTEPVLQEREGLHGKRVVAAVAGTVAMAIGAVVVVMVFLHVEAKRLGGTTHTPAYPAGETVGGIEQTPIDGPPRGEELEARKRAALDAYGWVDRRRGIAAIPIEKAIAWLVSDAKNGTFTSPDRATVTDADAGLLEKATR